MPDPLGTPEWDLPRPRLIILHGEITDDIQARALEVVGSAYEDLMERAPNELPDLVAERGARGGGSDWTGFHLVDPTAVEHLADLARSHAPGSWRIELQV